MLVGAELVSPVEFWQLHPFEVHWLIDARSDQTESRRQEEQNAVLYDTLKEAKGDAPPMTLADLKAKLARDAERADA